MATTISQANWGTAATTNTITWVDPNYYQSIQPIYKFSDPVNYNDKPVKSKVAHNFPFKKSLGLGLSAQLQGHFDNWAGSIKKDIFG